MFNLTNIIRPDNRNLLIACTIAIIIGVIFLCLIAAVDSDGSKIVVGSIGGVLIVVPALVAYIAITVKPPDQTQIIEMRKIEKLAEKEIQSDLNRLTT